MRRTSWLLLALLCGAAVAQATLATFDGGELGYRLGYPNHWLLEQADDASYLNIQPRPGDGAEGRVAIEFLATAEVTGTLEEGIEEVLAELRANLLPDLNVVSRTPTSVSGVPAVVIRLTGTVDRTHAVTYRLLAAVAGQRGYVLFLEALSEHYAEFEPLFDQVQASLSLAPAHASVAPPLSPLAVPSVPPDYVGTFADQQLRLTLEAPSMPGGAYSGTLHHGDQRYPVSARHTPRGLEGEFESGGHRFAFTVRLAGHRLTFETGGVSYVLLRETVPPPAAVNPLAPMPGPVGPGGTPPVAVEVVADETRSAVIGALPPNGSARGRLDGAVDAFAYHTYVIDVPAGAVSMTLVLDADTDLDIAVKHGSDIHSYADKDRGGDWDYRDIGTQNPTTIVIDRPAQGRWYVDVINALRAPNDGHYRLTVTTPLGGS